MKILVVGAGLVGNVIAQDLAATEEFSVTVCDVSKESLTRLSGFDLLVKHVLNTGASDEIAALSQSFDLVVSAVPGNYGYATLEALLEAGKKVVDIAFFPQDPRPLAAIARKHKASAVLDCGVAPGLSNLMIGRSAAKLDQVSSARILVGGLPKIRTKPFEYKAVFSPRDVIEEYIRPARMMEGGEIVVKEALTECETIQIPQVGTLEAFNTDGLRSLLWTMKIPRMSEKTIRYPGYCQKVTFLKEIGFFNEGKLSDELPVSPLDVTSHLLLEDWRLHPGEEDLTVMQVEVEGEKGGKRVKFHYSLIDYFDQEKQHTSMSRTTGFTAAGVVRAAAKQLWGEPGIHFPETLGADAKLFDFIQQDLRERGVEFSSEEHFLEESAHC